MSDFINTIDLLGDEIVIDSIINRTITEFKDDTVNIVGLRAFYGCTNLTAINLPNVGGNPVYDVGHSAFYGCTALKNVNLPNFATTSSATGYIFTNCTSLERIVLPKLKNVALGMFRYCSALVTVDLSVATNISGTAFEGCENLKCLVLRTNSVCTLGSSTTTFRNSGIANGIGYIYVPRVYLESYKIETNWSVYANQFRALEDYTVDGTITGELDESKI